MDKICTNENGNESSNENRHFHFPFIPYDIQSEFMRSLYSVINENKIGIFESPTGTGKSLSITCAALTWLADFEKSSLADLRKEIERLSIEVNESNDNIGRDWINDQYETILKRNILREKKLHLEQINDQIEKIEKLRRGKAEQKRNNYKKLSRDDVELSETEKIEERDDFLIQDEHEDELLENEETDNKYSGTKIYFCSRTHSQLKQIVSEIKKTDFKTLTRVISLSSRQQYCINENVRKLESNSLINERCLELQKNKSKVTSVDAENRTIKKQKQSSHKCPYYNQNLIENLKNESLVNIMDIEDLVKTAKTQKACPYYSSRLAITDAQIIMVPYQIMLHQRTREQSGIDLRGNIVIIDEAHNLLDTISNIHSFEISLDTMIRLKQQILSYKQCYFSKFSAKNLLKINQIVFIVNRLIKVFDVKEGHPSRMVFSHELLTEAELFNMNLFEIIKFCEETKLAQKVHGFSQKMPIPEVKAPDDKPAGVRNLLKKIVNRNEKPTVNRIAEEVPEKENVLHPNAMMPLISFLQCLLQNYEDGRVLITYVNDKIQSKSSMKYILLNPGARFNDILVQCRSLILAGGTMQPISEFTEQLFKSCPERVSIHCYDHIVSDDAVIALGVSKGPTGKTFLYNYANRDNSELMKELASTIQNVCNVVPSGVICFFSSYENLLNFHKYLTESSLLQSLENKKRIFIEPRGSGNVDQILLQYSKAAKSDKKFLTKESQNGALMLSVVGGKLSEGLNFSDELGRCVIIVGLPYPNKFNPELAEKIKYLDKTLYVGAGNEYYENLCMKAVNQCIGRAVRHINDYASVILLDTRYTQDKIIKKLPPWISKQLICSTTYGQVHSSLVKFFKLKR